MVTYIADSETQAAAKEARTRVATACCGVCVFLQYDSSLARHSIESEDDSGQESQQDPPCRMTASFGDHELVNYW